VDANLRALDPRQFGLPKAHGELAAQVAVLVGVLYVRVSDQKLPQEEVEVLFSAQDHVLAQAFEESVHLLDESIPHQAEQSATESASSIEGVGFAVKQGEDGHANALPGNEVGQQRFISQGRHDVIEVVLAVRRWPGFLCVCFSA